METGWSGLHYAAWGNYGDLLDLLLDQAGVNTNIKAQTETDHSRLCPCNSGGFISRETQNRPNRHHKSLLSNRNDTQNVSWHLLESKVRDLYMFVVAGR